MPIAPSVAGPTPDGAQAPTVIAPAKPSAPPVAPTKILPVAQPESWQVVPTHTTVAPASTPQPAAATTGPSLRRSRNLALIVTAALVVLLALAAWVFQGSTAHRASPSPAAVEVPPPPSTPVAPTLPESPPAGVAPSQPADSPPKLAPRKPRKGPRSSVKFTPEGVPII